MKDFFISYTSTDAPWAEWIAWQLENSGYTVILQLWDFPPGSNFVLAMQEANSKANTTLAVLSADYIKKPFPSSEWAAAFAEDPKGEQRTLIPVKVSPVALTGLLATIVHIDISSAIDEEEAIRKLLDGVGGKRTKPNRAPRFPSHENPRKTGAPRYPGIDNPPPKGGIRRFVCQKISNRQLLDLDNIDYPYGVFSDPTEFIDNENINTINCVLWIPQTRYIKSSPLQRYTPSVAVCFEDQSQFCTELDTLFDDDIFFKLLTLRPSKVRNNEKEHLFFALGKVLYEDFVAAVTLPEIMLLPGRKNPMVAYSAFFDILLLPLVQMHKKHNVARFHLILPNIGEQSSNVLSAVKKIMKAIYHEKGTFEVTLSQNNDNWIKIGAAAKFIAWAVGVAHNQKNDKWLSCLERGLEDAASSHSDEAASRMTSHV